MSTWKNRIVSYKQVPANELLANPMNARRHPAKQREALRGSLDTLGIIAPVIVNARTGYLIDGHARIEEALSKDENLLIPVVEVDLSPEEELTALASYDFITYLAEYDKQILGDLLEQVEASDTRVQALLTELAQEQGVIAPDFSPLGLDAQPRLDELAPKFVTCPHCGEQFDLRTIENA